MRIFYIFLALLLSLSPLRAQQQSEQTMKNDFYTRSWNAVKKFEKQSLPKSAAAEVDKILRQAVNDKNSQQIIKSIIHQGKYDMVIGSENNDAIFVRLDSMLTESRDDVERAVLNSMLAELYIQYYSGSRWVIDQRTQLGDFVPDDMKEWTTNIFFDRVIKHVNASLVAQKKLEETQVSQYSEVVDMEDGSRRFFPSMYDFLALRAIEILAPLDGDEELGKHLRKRGLSIDKLMVLPEEFAEMTFDPQPDEYKLWLLETFRKLTASLLNRGMARSTVILDLRGSALGRIGYLNRLGYSNVGGNADRTTARYEVYLNLLLDKWKDDELSVEIVNAIATTQFQNNGQTADGDVYDLVKATIARFPKYERIGILKNQLTRMTQPFINLQGKRVFPLNGEKEWGATRRSVSNLVLYKTDPAKAYLWNNDNSTKVRTQFVARIDAKSKQEHPYQSVIDSIKANVDQYGTYFLGVDDGDSFPGMTFSVSDLMTFARAMRDGSCEVYVVNRITGHPVEGANVEVCELSGRWGKFYLNTIQRQTTDASGLARIEKPCDKVNGRISYRVSAGNDNGMEFASLPYSYYYTEGNRTKTVEQLTVLTDRGIYRPGQTVYFKVIAGGMHDGSTRVLPERRYKVVLEDANGQPIAEKEMTTNEFGSFAGEFVLPHGALGGMFNIKVDNSYLRFRVEEYKRPTFEVSFDKIDQTYRFGEPVALRGKAESYSGIKLQDTPVQYTITRRQAWWRGVWGTPPQHFADGETVTDKSGAFVVNFTPTVDSFGELDADYEALRNMPMYVFTVNATITDANGETQTASYDVVVSRISMMLSIGVEPMLEKSSGKPIHISASNLDGNEIKASGTYTLFTVLDNDSTGRQVLQGKFETGEQKDLHKRLIKLSSGKYRLMLQSADDNGNKVEAKQDFVLFSHADKRPPIKTNNWFVVKNREFSPTTPAEIIVGVSDNDVNALYELWHGATMIERKWITLNNECRTFTIKHDQRYKNGLMLMITLVKNEEFISHRAEMVEKKVEQGISAKLSVFRDKLLPGSAEEWRLTITDAQGKPVSAEVLASMYDLSLDAIAKSPNWLLRKPYLRLPQSTSTYSPENIYGRYSFSYYGHIKHISTDELLFDRFNWFGFSINSFNQFIYGSRSAGAVLRESVIMADAAEPRVMASKAQFVSPVEEVMELTGADNNLQQGEESAQQPAIRRNFNETAFFFPQLRTNNEGETIIAFTVPESNTRWKFRVLAHDKNFEAAQMEAIAVSQKELMVTPNIPRFVRQGDRVSIATKISNLSDGAVTGTVSLQLFDPVTDQPQAISIDQPQQTFALEPDASGNAQWTVVVPAGIDLLGVRIVAQSENFSDGEQHALPVLPNRMLVTESMRMDVNGNQTKAFNMERIGENAHSSTADNYRLTLEFASNPAWYAVQALPVMSNPDNDNAVSWFASYYANTLGMHIGKSFPKVTAMIEAWKAQAGDATSLLSNLEKNEELKTVLLQETPWVMEARDESEQKQKLSLLFDLNRNSNATAQAIDKLQKLQDQSGGWAWFEGFRPSRSITTYILYGFEQLNELGVADTGVELMQYNAVEYIDSEALRMFESIKRYNKDWKKMQIVPISELEYIYVRKAYMQHEPDAKTREMIDFYTSVAISNWTKYSLYGRSLIAILAQRNGQTSVVKDILESYRQHATHSDELGMYWANNKMHVFMSLSAVSCHTFIMEAFAKGGADAAEMDNMKRWLLKQKQTQLWESSHASIDAIYALLSTGSDWFGSSAKTTISVGEQTVDAGKAELGTGYFKTSWSRTDIAPPMANVKVEHEGNSPAWGAMYLQYFEDLDKITKTDASLDIEKLLFVERSTGSGAKLELLDQNATLHIGDKVMVRLTVRTDRDLEFVHLKDLRAACFEPIEQLSGVKWQNSTLYYRSTRDASVNFYFDTLPRGTYVFEYPMFVTRSGDYSNGITTLQCLYAPEFTSHTAGIRVKVEE